MKTPEIDLQEELRRTWAKGKRVRSVSRIRSEASLRQFFRLHHDSGTWVAMVYPEPHPDEVDRICRFTRLYREHGLWTPRVLDVVDNRIVVQEDAGDDLLQRVFRTQRPREKRATAATWGRMLGRLRGIDPRHTPARLDRARMKRELDFFLDHFPGLVPGLRFRAAALRLLLHRLADGMGPESTFAHRDFHTRNMLLRDGKIFLVDFQDSLLAPPLYDLVSLAFDAYCDLGSGRKELLAQYEKEVMPIDREQLLLTALQRNIKALGTFGFQVTVRGNGRYRLYVPRTLRYVLDHFQKLGRSEYAPLEKFFSRALDLISR